MIRLLHYGLGPIGCGIARLACQREGLEPVAAVDIDPNKVGQDLGSVIGLERPLGILVSPKVTALKGVVAQVAIHSTGSNLEEVYPQLEELIKARLDIISTCEELAYPRLSHPDLAAKLDRLAKKNEVTVLGTGVNPGFVMDTLPLALSAACQVVGKVQVQRKVDISARRLNLQRKAGAGLTPAQFQEGVKARKIGHVGLRESVALLAAALGWELEAIQEEIEPVVAEKALRSEFIEVKPGQAAGLHQVSRGIKGGKEVITLDLQMCLGVKEPGDYITIEGTIPLKMALQGVQGDLATAAVVVNAIPSVVNAPPGLLTMADLPLVHAYLKA